MMNNKIELSNLENYNKANEKPRKSFTSEFRNQVIGVYKSGVYDSVPACALAYGISSKTLYNWLLKLNLNSTTSAISDQQAELATLKKSLRKLRWRMKY
jgi:transposase-like protein